MSIVSLRSAVVLLVSLTTLLALPVASPAAVPPGVVVTTLPATAGTGSTLQLHGTVVTPTEGAVVSFRYGFSPTALDRQPPGVGEGPSADPIPALAEIPVQPGKTYYFQLTAAGLGGDWVASGEILQAMVPGPPQVLAAPATDITYKSATLHITVTTGGLPTTLTGTIQGASGPIPLGPVTVTADGDVALPVTGLQAGVDAAYRVFAKNSAGGDSVGRAVVRTLPLSPAVRPMLSATKVRYGTSVRITGAFAGHPGLSVALHEQRFPLLTSLNPATAATTATDAQGAFAFAVRAVRPASYGVTVAEGFFLPQAAQLARLGVFPAVTAKVRRGARHRFVVSGSYRPTGVAAKASLYRGGAVKVGTAVSSTGRFTFPARALKAGHYEVRVVPATSTGYLRGKSATLTVPRRR